MIPNIGEQEMNEDRTLENVVSFESGNEPREPHPLLRRLSTMLAFETFWEKYPRKERKVEAFYAFMDAVENTTAENILASLEAQNMERNKYSVSCIHRLASDWLKQECWNDVAKICKNGRV